MFFKELACLYCLVINVHFSWNALRSNTFAYHSFATALLYYHVLQTLSTTFLFFILLSSELCKPMRFANQLCYNSMEVYQSQHKIRQKIK